jgi:hypothetical protein
MINHWKKHKELAAHNPLEELNKPDEFNDRIITSVNLVIENLSQPYNKTAETSDLATLAEFIQRRNSKKEVQRRQLRL